MLYVPQVSHLQTLSVLHVFARRVCVVNLSALYLTMYSGHPAGKLGKRDIRGLCQSRAASL